MGLQFKKELADKIMQGQKTQTRRPVKPHECLRRCYTDGIDTSRTKAYYETVFTEKGHVKWQEGRTYAVQPGRGKKGIGFIEVTQIRYQDVREISLADAKAEGFETIMDFIAVWVGFYDDQVHLDKLPNNRWRLYISRPPSRMEKGGVTVSIKETTLEVTGSAYQILDVIKQHRPDKLYKAWVIEFILLTPVAVSS